ncbi:MAG TPA: efflux RND transporter periplasmic adaptor subunit [Xanthobacteraceae bacterium]
MRRLLTIVLVLALGGAAVVYFFPEWTSAPAEPGYRMAKLDRGPIVAVVNATGTINPTTTVIVSSQLSGQVVEVLADYNSEVQAGQVVARLNSDQIRAKLDAARADLQQMRATRAVQEAQIKRVLADIERAHATETDMQAQIARNEALLADSERAVVRQTDLRTRGVTSEATFETSRAQRDAQKAALDSARAQLASAKAQSLGLDADQQVARAQLQAVEAQILQREATVRQIEVDLRNTEIRSPVSGTVVQRQVELGQTVAASMTAPTLFLIADDLRHMEIAANIDETDVGRIRAGQRASFTVNAYPGRTFQGTLKQVRLGSQTVQNVVIYTTIIAVENPRQELLPGMTANLRVETDARTDVLRVPNAALRWRPANAAADAPPAPAAAAVAAEAGSEAPRQGRSGGSGGGRVLAELAEAMKAELALTPEQQKDVDAAMAEMRGAFGALRGESDQGARRERVQVLRTQFEDRVNALLIPEQRGKFEQLRARMAQNRGGGDGTQSGRIYVLGAGGKPEAVQVRLGVGDGTVTELVGAPVDAGREVIVGGGPRAAEPTATGSSRGPRFGF